MNFVLACMNVVLVKSSSNYCIMLNHAMFSKLGIKEEIIFQMACMMYEHEMVCTGSFLGWSSYERSPNSGSWDFDEFSRVFGLCLITRYLLATRL